MNEAEADQIREAAEKPQKRFHLFITFAKARLTAIDQFARRSEDGPGARTADHDLLEDFQALVDGPK